MEQKVYLENSLKESLKRIVSELLPTKVLLVTGQKSFEISGAQLICDEALEKLEVFQFTDFSINPSIEDVNKGIEIWQSIKPDLVLAIGGGSAIDIAKAINILAVQGRDNISDYITGLKKVSKKGSPLVAVPMTSGTGAEATHFAVVYIGTKKYSLAHQYILPDYAIVNSALTHSLSSYQTAVTGLDALSQAVESMWSVNSTEESRKYVHEAITRIYAHFEKAVVNPDEISRREMSIGAHLAGKAINISKTTASHAMSYALTANYGVPHGHAVALTLPELIRFNSGVSVSDIADSRGVAHVQTVLKEIADLFGVKTTEEVAQKIEQLIKTVSLPTRLSELGVKENHLPDLIKEMSVERAGNNPRTFTADDALGILKKIL